MFSKEKKNSTYAGNGNTTEYINRKTIPGIKPVLEYRKQGFLKRIWHAFKYDIKDSYIGVCILLYLLFIIGKALGPAVDAPIITASLDLIDVCLILALILSLPLVIEIIIHLRDKKTEKARASYWKEMGRSVAIAGNPRYVKGNGRDLYYESLTGTYIDQEFSGNPYHEPIEKIEIYEDNIGNNKNLRMHVYYLHNWESSIQKTTESDISLENITEESIENLLMYPQAQRIYIQ